MGNIKRNSNKLVITAVLAAMLVLMVYAFKSTVDMSLASNPLEFTLKDTSGQAYDLGRLKGKVVIIDFWATWCKPCEKTTPDLIRLKQKYGPRGDFEILGVSIDEGGPAIVEQFAKRYGMNYPVLMASPEFLTAFKYPFQIPTMFFVNQNGGIERSLLGVHKLSTLEILIDKMFADTEE